MSEIGSSTCEGMYICRRRVGVRGLLLIVMSCRNADNFIGIQSLVVLLE